MGQKREMTLHQMEHYLQMSIQDTWNSAAVIAAEIEVGSSIVVGFLDHYDDRIFSVRITRTEKDLFEVEEL